MKSERAYHASVAPRSVEIDPEVDDDRGAVYFRTIAHGLFVRHGLTLRIV